MYMQELGKSLSCAFIIRLISICDAFSGSRSDVVWLACCFHRWIFGSLRSPSTTMILYNYTRWLFFRIQGMYLRARTFKCLHPRAHVCFMFAGKFTRKRNIRSLVHTRITDDAYKNHGIMMAICSKGALKATRSDTRHPQIWNRIIIALRSRWHNFFSSLLTQCVDVSCGGGMVPWAAHHEPWKWKSLWM